MVPRFKIHASNKPGGNQRGQQYLETNQVNVPKKKKIEVEE
jgi:hypothetical protein